MQRFDKYARPTFANLSTRHQLSQGKIVDAVPIQRKPTVVYNCTQCKDVGYLRANVPYGHPQFGKAVECECTKAKKKEALRKKLWEQSKIDRQIAFQEASFSTFQFRLPGVQKAYDASEEFANTRTGWLVLQGRNGCGKTHLAVSIAKQCLESGASVLFQNVPDMLGYLKSTFSPKGEERYDDEFKKMCEVEVLLLDDLGAEQGTPWAIETLYLLFNHRYTARLATVVTTNIMDLERIDPRIGTRLGDIHLAKIIKMEGAQNFRSMKL